MCQLLGISYNRPSPFNEVFNEFRKRGETNPDAWGLAYWTGDSHGPAVMREARAAHQSPLAAAIAKSSIPAAVVIAHVRLSTTAAAWSKKATTNAHPFLFSVNTPVGRREWVFAHNGYVRVFAAPRLRHLEGNTDSEHIFTLMAEALEKAGAVNPERAFEVIARVTASYTNRGRLNFLASDGDNLFFHASHPENLYYRAMEARGKKALLVATRPLFTENGWTAVPAGTLFAAAGGRLVLKEKVNVYSAAGDIWTWPRTRRMTREGGRYLSYIDYLERDMAKNT